MLDGEDEVITIRKLMLSASIASAVAVSGLVSTTVAADSSKVSPNDWPQYHRTSDAWRYSPLDQINAGNINKLKVAWIHQPGDIQMGLQATPIVIDGVAYYIGPNNNVFALNAATGEQIWHYQPELDEIVNEVFYVAASRGVTVGHGNVYVGSLDGRFIALDQKTGKEKWSTQITDLESCYGCLFSSPPQLAGDVLFGGTTGGDQPTQGKIFAVNAKTGEPMWTFDILQKDDPKSWPGDSGEVGGSGAWLPGTYDEKTDTIYIGTANAAPDFYGAERVGDNKWSASLLAIDPKTGKLKWGRQEIPHDVWDYDASYEAVALKHNGKDVLVHLNKSGFVFVVDKKDGAIENVWPLAQNINFVDGINPKTGELGKRLPMPVGEETTICPYLLGARSWNHGAYNPNTGLWYTNAMEVCNVVVPAAQEHESVGLAGLYLGVSKLVAVPPPGGKASARLDARDPITGKLKWSIDYPLPGLSSVLTTGGNLVFNGSPKGIIHAYNAENGKEVWNFNAGSGLRGGIVSYSVNGKQYILASTGMGSHAPGFMASAFPEMGGLPGGAALIAFTLGE
ncbi:PQQ-binding-like beta-propeller repeat protein [Neptuniibacter sp. CAU 1671]|uniref:pyrroloquinoline quinone-dependent dehydrogenase n=1 Tax=Neptuniibacter sp. CAU 1671 TaxID=3032593 RepID=UPI0023DB3159|nr:PQQ-binding-like beta-propeller repeat protein [Neptuniibacter sp. CAU 1671]MDF2181949.1 PQQ-binding-like beta-propeller repeat protein [Neptuniibacter sp. CAU 1671]